MGVKKWRELEQRLKRYLADKMIHSIDYKPQEFIQGPGYFFAFPLLIGIVATPIFLLYKTISYCNSIKKIDETEFKNRRFIRVTSFLMFAVIPAFCSSVYLAGCALPIIWSIGKYTLFSAGNLTYRIFRYIRS